MEHVLNHRGNRGEKGFTQGGQLEPESLMGLVGDKKSCVKMENMPEV